jgi:N6-adenosine-specific RNA methylase IME4
MSNNHSTGIVPVTAAASLEIFNRLRQELERAQTLPDILKVRNVAKAYEKYFLAIQHRQAAKLAAELRLRSERKAGGKLKQTGDNRERQMPPPKGGGSNNVLLPSLADLGITKMQSFRWQEIDRIKKPVFEGYIKDALEKPWHELTTSGLMTVAKFDRKDDQAEEIRNEPEPLLEGPFRVIVADPPWPYAMRRPTINDSRGYPEYSGMTLDEITALPVADLAAEDAVLWLWTTNAFLPDAFQVIQSWGFQYRAALVWGKDHIGLGDWLRVQTEHCLMASRGKPVITLTNQSTLLRAPIREHSRKPEEFYTMIESLCPTPPLGRIELFARGERPGWRVWGHESRS